MLSMKRLYLSLWYRPGVRSASGLRRCLHISSGLRDEPSNAQDRRPVGLWLLFRFLPRFAVTCMMIFAHITRSVLSCAYGCFLLACLLLICFLLAFLLAWSYIYLTLMSIIDFLFIIPNHEKIQACLWNSWNSWNSSNDLSPLLPLRKAQMH